MVADHLRFDVRGIDAEMLAEVNAEAQAVENVPVLSTRSCRGRLARDVGERIGRIGDGDQHRVGRGAHDPRHDVAIDLGILVEQPEAPLRVVAVGRTAGFLVDAGRDQHDAGAGEGVIVAVDDLDLGTKRRAVAHVGRDRLGGLAGAVDQHDLARAAAGDGSHGARRSRHCRCR